MQKIFTFILCCLSVVVLRAETLDEYSYYRNEMRLMIGDPSFETLIWHNDTRGDYTGLLGPDGVAYEKHNTLYSPHMAFEYGFRVRPWITLGLQVDFQTTTWHTIGYNTLNTSVSDQRNYFYNLSFLPTMRFTYVHTRHFNMYSSVGVGVDVNGGSEVDLQGRNTVVAPVFDMAVFGFRFGKERWHGMLELGGTTSLLDANRIFMLCSRFVRAGVCVSIK